LPPSLEVINTSCPIFTFHSDTLPIASLHKKLSYPRFATCILKGFSVSFVASSTFSIITSKRGVIFVEVSISSFLAIHSLAIV
jgi:hypothetical protein